jgi:hypothetical protein
LTNVGTLASSAVSPVGKHRNTVYLRDYSAAGSFLVVDVDPFAVRNVDAGVIPLAVAPVTDGLVVTHAAGAGYRFLLVKPAGERVDLTQRIDAAASNVPRELRAPLQMPTTLGEWLIFSANAGILAFRPRDEKLLPLQIRADADRFVFDVPHVVEGARALVFRIGASELQGLYCVKLDGVLPK